MSSFHDPSEPPAVQVEYEQALQAWIMARGDELDPARARLDAARSALRNRES